MTGRTDVPSSVVWSSKAWLDEAVRWSDAQLATAGLARTGPAEQVRVRPWSTLVRLPVGDGVVWMKACTAGTAYEAAVVGLLAGRVPGSVLTPIAADAERGWLLAPDGGPILREAVASGERVEVWRTVLRHYASLQRRLVPFAGELTAAGTPELTPAALLAETPRLLQRYGGGRRLRPDVAEAGTRLAEGVVPMSLQHDDFHAGNVFAGVDGHGRPVVFDWGDAYVGHPFASMLVALSSLAYELGHDLTADEIRGLHLAYLDPWLDLAPLDVLERELHDAVAIAPIGRALGWERALARATDDELAEWGEGMTGWTDEFAEPVADGRA